MKRNMDLCREILFKIEDEYTDHLIMTLQVPGYSLQEVAYHCQLLCDAGLLSQYCPINTLSGILGFQVGSLTWEGHDFLDKIREDTIWNKTKEVITKKGLPMVLDVVKTVATDIITSMTKGAVQAMLNP